MFLKIQHEQIINVCSVNLIILDTGATISCNQCNDLGPDDNSLEFTLVGGVGLLKPQVLA